MVCAIGVAVKKRAPSHKGKGRHIHGGLEGRTWEGLA